MDKNLAKFIEDYNNAPEIFQATRYWKGYEDKIIQEVVNADLSKLRSGEYPIFGTFGFMESVYSYARMPFHTKMAKKMIRRLFITNKHNMPYSLSMDDIREMAYHHCIVKGNCSNARSIQDIEVSEYGSPDDFFQVNGNNYTMRFLSLYLRYCFAQNFMDLKGDEVIVELGSGSGHQVEILKKLYPDLTILCFDLPVPLYLCQKYLTEALGEDSIVGYEKTMNEDLSGDFKIQKGKVYFFGNWMFPILKKLKFDIFWNAASFGEMEPEVVKNYLSYVLGNCDWIYLLQARKGKESSSDSGVKKPIRFEDYNEMLQGYQLIKEEDAYEAHRRLSQSGGYFEAIWRKNEG